MEETSEDAQSQSSRSEDFREADVSTAAGASEGGRGIEEQGGGERKEEEKEATVGGETRSSKPGCKRLLITLSVVFSFLLGVPGWWKSTEVYRAPLPFSAIEEHAIDLASSAFALPCHLHIIFAVNPSVHTQQLGLMSEKSLYKVANSFQQHIDKVVRGMQSNHSEGCFSNFGVLVTLDAANSCVSTGNENGVEQWPCGLAKSGLHEIVQLSDDKGIDDFLWSFSKGGSSSTGGRYTVVVIGKGPNEEIIEGTIGKKLAGGTGSIDRTVVGTHRHAWMTGVDFSVSGFEEEIASHIAQVAVTYFRNGGNKRGNPEVDHVASLPLSANGEAILSFSLLNANPEDWIFDCCLVLCKEIMGVLSIVFNAMKTRDIEEMEERYLKPLIAVMEPVARLSVESQVLYYTPKAIPSHWNGGLKAHVVPFKQLPFFVNSNEWHLDTSSAATGRSKLLNFAIYVPAGNECPLHIQLSNARLSPTNGFTSPGWGGVIIYNPPGCGYLVTNKSDSHRLSTKELEPAIGVIVAQIRALFGLPPTFMEDAKTKTYGVPAGVTGIADWEVDVLLRRRASMDINASASTLASLSRLVSSLPNMVVKDEIGDQVRSSLAQAKAAQKHSSAGAYHAAAEAARKARSLAEAAFFQPSIMSLLYFPAEHQLAIYTPFFVPVLLHMLVAVLKEGSRYRREWKKYQRFLQKQ